MNYFSRVRLNQSALANYLLKPENRAYQLHQTLWELFPDQAERSFLFREFEDRGGVINYFLLSSIPPKDHHPWIAQIDSKPYAPNLRNGQQFTFDLRANPVVSVKKPNGKSARHDVLMMAKKAAKAENPEIHGQELQEIMLEAAAEWLRNEERKAKWGIEIEEILEISAYQQHQLTRRSEKSPTIRFSSVDYKGQLRIVEAERFIDQLCKGFGHSKAFGCGLMLLRRI